MAKPKFRAFVCVRKNWAQSSGWAELFMPDNYARDVVSLKATNYDTSNPMFTEVTFQPPGSKSLLKAVIPTDQIVLIFETRDPATRRALGFEKEDSAPPSEGGKRPT